MSPEATSDNLSPESISENISPEATSDNLSPKAATGTLSPEAARAELARRAEAIEGGYELMLGYAAQGLHSDQGAANSGQLRDHLTRFADALTGLPGVYRDCAKALGVGPQDALDGFLEVLSRDAVATQAALRLLLGQSGISSQMVDNVNASIHVRALLTDVFVVDEIIKHAGSIT